MQAIVIEQKDKKTNIVTYKEIDAPALVENGVRVRVEYSGMNYKDALVLSGIGGIVQKFPMVAGIDFAGKVIESLDKSFSVGDTVLCTGWGMVEQHWGGYADEACVPGHFLCRLPDGCDSSWAMQLGTAGFTAMMAVIRLEESGALTIDKPIAVTGAGGGVGGIALMILEKLGHKAEAISSRPELKDYFQSLGASTVIHHKEASDVKGALGAMRWAGVIDNVGGDILAGILKQLAYGGAASLCGMASSTNYPATVIPFILRGINVYGIESVHYPGELRPKIWQRLAELVDKAKLQSMISETISVKECLDYAPRLLGGKIQGRLLVKVN